MNRIRYINGWYYCIPGLILFLIIVVWPLLTSLYYSFFRLFLYQFKDPRVFVGFNNYISVLKEPLFLNALRVTFTYTFFVSGLSILVGLFLALLLNNDCVKIKNVFLVLFLIPHVISQSVLGVVWRLFMFSPSRGTINLFLNSIGIEGPRWFLSPNTSMISIIIVGVWTLSPFAFLVFYSALTTIPEEIIDASKIDGAGPVSVFRYIVFPFLKPHTLFISLMLITGTYRQFDLVYLLTGGGPARATENLSILVYKLGVTAQNIGESSAVAFIMFFTIATICILFIRFFKIGQREEGK